MRCLPAYTARRMLFPARYSIAVEVNDAVIAYIFLATASRIFIHGILISESVAILIISGKGLKVKIFDCALPKNGMGKND